MRRALTTVQMRMDQSGNLTASNRSIASATMILEVKTSIRLRRCSVLVLPRAHRIEHKSNVIVEPARESRVLDEGRFGRIFTPILVYAIDGRDGW